MYVYRLEYKDKGIYESNFFWIYRNELNPYGGDSHYDNPPPSLDKHPCGKHTALSRMFYCDYLDNFINGYISESKTRMYYCGFESVDQMYSWFGFVFVRKCLELGACIKVYRVNKRLVKSGVRQIMFVKEKATYIKTIEKYNIYEMPMAA